MPIPSPRPDRCSLADDALAGDVVCAGAKGIVRKRAPAGYLHVGRAWPALACGFTDGGQCPPYDGLSKRTVPAGMRGMPIPSPRPGRCPLADDALAGDVVRAKAKGIARKRAPAGDLHVGWAWPALAYGFTDGGQCPPYDGLSKRAVPAGMGNIPISPLILGRSPLAGDALAGDVVCARAKGIARKRAPAGYLHVGRAWPALAYGFTDGGQCPPCDGLSKRTVPAGMENIPISPPILGRSPLAGDLRVGRAWPALACGFADGGQCPPYGIGGRRERADACH